MGIYPFPYVYVQRPGFNVITTQSLLLGLDSRFSPEPIVTLRNGTSGLGVSMLITLLGLFVSRDLISGDVIIPSA